MPGPTQPPIDVEKIAKLIAELIAQLPHKDPNGIIGAQVLEDIPDQTSWRVLKLHDAWLSSQITFSFQLAIIDAIVTPHISRMEQRDLVLALRGLYNSHISTLIEKTLQQNNPRLTICKGIRKRIPQ